MQPRVWLAFGKEINKMILKFRCQFKAHEIEVGKKKKKYWKKNNIGELTYLFQNLQI